MYKALSFIIKSACIKVWIIRHQVTFIFHENVRYFSLLLGENGLDNGVHFTSELSDFDTFHLVDALTYARKQSFSSNSSLIRTFLGGYFALGEGISRKATFQDRLGRGWGF